jgi:hypothetical protein
MHGRVEEIRAAALEIATRSRHSCAGTAAHASVECMKAGSHSEYLVIDIASRTIGESSSSSASPRAYRGSAVMHSRAPGRRNATFETRVPVYQVAVIALLPAGVHEAVATRGALAAVEAPIGVVQVAIITSLVAGPDLPVAAGRRNTGPQAGVRVFCVAVVARLVSLENAIATTPAPRRSSFVCSWTTWEQPSLRILGDRHGIEHDRRAVLADCQRPPRQRERDRAQ